MKEVDMLVKRAKALGACDLLEDNATIWKLDELMWHPQGMEFCVKRRFPSLNSLRRLSAEGYNGIIVDGGDVQSYAYRNAIAGETNMTLVADNVREKYDVILFHGAGLVIEASNYAVVHVTRVGRCNVEFRNIDGTAVLLD